MMYINKSKLRRVFCGWKFVVADYAETGEALDKVAASRKQKAILVRWRIGAYQQMELRSRCAHYQKTLM